MPYGTSRLEDNSALLALGCRFLLIYATCTCVASATHPSIGSAVLTLGTLPILVNDSNPWTVFFSLGELRRLLARASSGPDPEIDRDSPRDGLLTRAGLAGL